MKAIASKIVRCLPVGAVITCADNSGAKEFQIISVRGYKGIRRTKPSAGVGSLTVCRVWRGNEKVRHQMFKVVIIRQRKEYRRRDGLRIRFEDNAGIMVDDKFEPKGTVIKGPVAREAVDRFSTIGKFASIIA
ncbi:MAG TPA: uL14 family ribosomal protein [archaeon]|nr:uL14 family ribosomal protein [archaeon]